MAETVFDNISLRGTLAVTGAVTLALVTLSNTLTLQNGANFTANGSSTGVVLQVSGTTRYQTLSTTCTATGGSTGQYSTCALRSPLSTTGSLIEASLECGNVGTQLTGDISFKTARIAATGSALTNLDNITAGTGSLERSAFSTEVAWHPSKFLTYSTLVSPGSVDCKLWATLADQYGE